MPRDPKRNLQRYQLQGGHLNEFEFQKSQNEMAEESQLPFTDQTVEPYLTPARGIEELTAQAHQKVEKRRKRGLVKTGGRKTTTGAGKRSAKKVARKSATKTTKRAPAKKRATVSTKSMEDASTR